jgi:hypothetical protein
VVVMDEERGGLDGCFEERGGVWMDALMYRLIKRCSSQ